MTLVVASSMADGLLYVPPRARLQPVEDTMIDKALPDTNFGREPAIAAGKDKAILIRFPQLSYETRPGFVSSAKLTLTFARQSNPGSLKIQKILAPWYEGAGREIRFDRVVNDQHSGATWNHAVSGKAGKKWSAADFASVPDQPTVRTEAGTLVIEGIDKLVADAVNNPEKNFGWRLEFTGDVSFFSGEFAETRPLLEFRSDAVPDIAGPDLAVTMVEPVGADKWRVTVANNGMPAPASTVTLTSTSGETRTASVPAIDREGTQTVEIAMSTKGDPTDQRRHTVSARVSSGGLVPNNDALTVYTAGIPVAVTLDPELATQLHAETHCSAAVALAKAVTEVNERVLPQSRFFFAPEGCAARVRLTSTAPAGQTINISSKFEGMTAQQTVVAAISRSLTPFTAKHAFPPSNLAPFDPMRRVTVGSLPDTRDCGLRILGLEIPDISWPTNIDNALPLWENGMLSRTEVAWIANATSAKPVDLWATISPGLLVHAMDASGFDIDGAELTLFRPAGESVGEPLSTCKSQRGGLAFFPAAKGSDGKAVPFTSNMAADGSNSWFLVKASKNGATASAWVPAWALLDWTARGTAGSPSVELRFMLPSEPLDAGQDMAFGKPATDSTGRFPAELSVVNDGDLATGVDFFPGTSLEIDMGRDRSFGQVEISTAPLALDSFEIKVYRTAQDPATALLWFKETSDGFMSRVFGKIQQGVTTVPYQAKVTQGRYLRLTHTGKAKVNLRSVVVRPIKAG